MVMSSIEVSVSALRYPDASLNVRVAPSLTRSSCAFTVPQKFASVLHRLTNNYDIAMLTVVKLAVEPETAAWLATAPAIEWDAGNSTKSETKHGFDTTSVESILKGPVLFAGRIVDPEHEEARYLLLGITASGRRAALIFARRGDKLRPISCRAMRRKEKEAYDAAT
jgi:uncharacterized DUF497 family protein